MKAVCRSVAQGELSCDCVGQLLIVVPFVYVLFLVNFE